MTTTRQRSAEYTGPALFSYGFRPFFLFGAIYSGVAILPWLLFLREGIDPGSNFTPVDWHIHEMLYGFVPAIIAGFLLTAIPNWTGRLPLKGAPLFVLFSVWLAGRVAVFASGSIGWSATAAIDLAFLVLVAAMALREIVAGRNWRNLKIVGVVSVLAAANFIFHLEAHYAGSANYGVRIGVGAVIFLITLVGGRITPSFTGNWLARQAPGRMPASFGRFDIAALAACFCGLLAWVVAPVSSITTGVMLAAGLLLFARLARWAGERTLKEPLVLVLHVAYAFIPAGFLLVGWSAAGSIPASAGIHAWTAGAMGTMILAVITRASLGHTGHALTASRATQAIYLAVILSALLRIYSPFQPEWYATLLVISGLAWMAAFLGFGAAYAPILCTPRRR